MSCFFLQLYLEVTQATTCCCWLLLSQLFWSKIETYKVAQQMVESVEMEEMMMVMKMIMKTKMKTFNQSSLDFCVKALLRHVYNLYSLFASLLLRLRLNNWLKLRHRKLKFHESWTVQLSGSNNSWLAAQMESSSNKGWNALNRVSPMFCCCFSFSFSFSCRSVGFSFCNC